MHRREGTNLLKLTDETAVKSLEHVNRVLRTIRDINRLITKEKENKALLNELCPLLVKSCGYNSAWIAVAENDILQSLLYSMGDQNFTQVYPGKIPSHFIPLCARHCLEKDSIHVIENSRECIACPFVQLHEEHTGFVIRLVHNGRTYGCLGVSVPKLYARSPEEKELFRELAGDISYALWSNEAEARRKSAELSLRESEERFHALFERAPLGYQSLDSDGRFLEINQAWLDTLGYERHEVVGRWFGDFLAPEYVQVFRERFPRFLAEGKDHSEFWMRHKNGTLRFISFEGRVGRDDDGTFKQTHCILSDQTKQKHALEDLRESELRYRSLFENDHTIMFLIDPDTSCIIDVNPAAVRFYGWTREEMQGKKISEINILTPQELENEMERARRGSRNYFQFRHKRKDGSIRDVEVYSGAIRLMRKDLLYSFIYDVTERQELENRLQQSEKMEAIGKLAGGIAHDFNNILGAIIGYADLSLDDASQDSRLERNLKQVLKAADRAKHLVRQILSFSRQSTDIKIPIHIRPILQEVVELLRASLPSTISIKTDFCPDTKPVFANGTKIHEIVMNLCTNAAYAMNEKGTLQIEYKEQQFHTELRGKAGISAPGFYSVITVRDNGVGMPDHVLPRIFEPYFTTKPLGEGTGMGLAVAFGIVLDHGGNILIDSIPGKGTTFKILLPKSDSEPIIEKKEQLRLQKGTERIMFVDDEDVLCEMYQDMLTNLGYKVSVFSNSVKALEAFYQRPDAYDLVITDQTMPTLTGIDLSKKLLEIRKDIPVILCTGYSKHVDKNSAHKAGIKAFCVKPIRMHDIARHIRMVLEKN